MKNIPVVTVTADAKKRIVLPTAKPGDRFDVEIGADGVFILRRLEPIKRARPVKVRFEKRGRYTVGLTDRPINMGVVTELLANFP